MQNMTPLSDPIKESKRQRFIRLANKRIEAACDDIRLIENLLQNPYAYDYDYRDVEVIVKRLLVPIKRLRTYKRMKYLAKIH